MAGTKTSVHTTIPRFTVQNSYNVSVMDMLDTGRFAVAGYNNTTKCSFIDLFMLQFPDSQEKPLLLTSEPYYSEEFTEFGSEWRSVCLLDNRLFLTCCKNTIALYDSSNGGLVNQGKFNGTARCMTTRDGLVYVGLYSNEMIVLDAIELEIKKTIPLKGFEGGIEWPYDIAVSNTKLFICTDHGRALMCNSEGEIEQKYTNTQYIYALSITVSEEKGLIFILWSDGGSRQVVVYTHSGGHASISGDHSSISGGHILASFRVPDNSRRIRISYNINRLFLVTQGTGEVYEYHTSDILTFHNLLMCSESLITKNDCKKLLDYFEVPAKESKGFIKSDKPFSSLVHHLREAGKVSSDDINYLMTACSDKGISKLMTVLTLYQQAQDSKFTKEVLKDQLRALEDKRQEPSHKLTESEDEKYQLTGRLKTTEEEKQQLKGTLKTTEEEKQQFKDVLKATGGERQQLTGRLKTIDEGRKQLKDTLKATEEERRQLTGRLKTTEEERQQLKDTLKATEGARQQLKGTPKTTEEERQQLRYTLKTTAEERQQLTGRLKTTEEERQQLRYTLKTTEEERQQLKGTLKTTEEERQQLKVALNATKEERQKLTGRLKKTEEEKKQINDTLKATEEERQQFKDALMATEKERQQLLERLTTTEEERQQSKVTLNETEEERQNFKDALKATEEERQQLKDALKATEEERQQLKDALKATDKDFRHTLNTAENKLKTLKDEKEELLQQQKEELEEAKSSLRATKDELVKSQLEYAKESMALQEVLKQTREALNQQELASYASVTAEETLLEECETQDASQKSTLAADYGRLMVNVADDLTLDSTLKLAILFGLPPAETDMLRRVSQIETPGITLINFMKTRNIINMYDVTNLQKGLVYIQLYYTNENLLAPYQSKVDPFQFEENQSPELLDWPVENVKFVPDDGSTPSQVSEEREEDYDHSQESSMEGTEREELPKQRNDSTILEMRHHHSYIEHRIKCEGGTISMMGVHLTIPEDALSCEGVISVKVIYDPDIHLPGSARRGRMTPLIKLEPEGLALNKPAQLTIPHSAIIPEPDRHDVIIFTGLKDEENLQEGEITWTEKKSVDWKLDPEKISLDINILSFVFVNLVSQETEQKHIFRIVPFIDGILDAKDDVLITICFCKDSDEEYKMLLEDHHSKLSLGNYTTYQVTRTLNDGRDYASFIDLMMSSPSDSYHLMKEESRKHVDIDHLCAASRVSHQFRLKRNNDGDTDMVDVKLTVSQHEMNQTALILQSKVKVPEKPVVISKREPQLSVNFKMLIEEGYKRLDVQRALKLSRGKLDLGRRILLLAKEEHERLPLFPGSNLYKEQYFDQHGGEVVIAGVILRVPAGALHTGRIVSLWVSTEPAIKGPSSNKNLRLTPFVKFGPESLTLHKPVTLIIPHCAFTTTNQMGLDVYSGVLQTDKSVKWSLERKHLSCSMNSQHLEVEAQKPCLIGLHVPSIAKMRKRICILPIVNRVSDSGDHMAIHLWFHNDDKLEHESLINEEIYQQKGTIIHDPVSVSVQLKSMTSTLYVSTNSSTPECNPHPRKVDVAMETLWVKNRHKVEFRLQNKGLKDTVHLKIEARYGMSVKNLFQLNIQLQIDKLLHIDQITSPFQLVLPESIINSFDQLKQNLSEHLDVDQSALLANIFQLSEEGISDIKKHKKPGTPLLEKLTKNSLISPTNITKLENTLTEQGNEECAKLVRKFRSKNPVVQATMCPE
ncbi:uncharacterized protein [Apostichopus japonicus]|uniref:uncharacterized protein isoform X4 n=1 Tax=Stichopus japonicus TaxID=307972 RepID=UPI003AB3A084